jgi:hypothetical protein
VSGTRYRLIVAFELGRQLDEDRLVADRVSPM